MGEGTDVIIRGGSVEIEFSEQVFPGKGGRYGNKHRKIESVEVIDDDTGQRHTVTVPAHGKFTIRVNTSTARR